jgi:hypothetical protein
MLQVYAVCTFAVQSFFAIIFLSVCRLVVDGGVRSPKVPLAPTLMPGAAVELEEVDRKALSAPVFLRRLVAMPVGIPNDPASAIGCHLAWENDAVSRTLCDAITERINAYDYYDFATAIKVLSSLLSLEDSRAMMRVQRPSAALWGMCGYSLVASCLQADYVLPTFFNIMEVNQNYYKATELSINCVLNIALKSAGKCVRVLHYVCLFSSLS